MEEKMLLLVFRIIVFLSMTDIHNVQLQTVPDPCPDTTPRMTIADLCTTDYATEDDNNGGTSVDSVALRAMTQQDGCECEVKLQNQTSIYTLNMRKYDLVRSAAPVQEACGLAIHIDYNIPNNLPETKDPIECTRGTGGRAITLLKNGVLYFRSRIIDGIFSTGYCIQIYRQDSTGNELRLQLHCSQYITTPPGKNITKCNESVSDNGNVRLPVIITAVIGWCLTALFAFTTLCLYRRINKQRPNISSEQHVNPQYEDLHVTRLSSSYSSLNAPTVNSEQYEHI
ncbi:unnamed protein product [Mytilus coruscus]|uniref:Uncharacterized protein n=1 Tax=Mytilus coruscus TaxID=42192 RepID=A0A6J8AVI1_MYTCO|nr:unnamed protein product [Mytilus coruscus]